MTHLVSSDYSVDANLVEMGVSDVLKVMRSMLTEVSNEDLKCTNGEENDSFLILEADIGNRCS